jgi:hypothetical protein
MAFLSGALSPALAAHIAAAIPRDQPSFGAVSFG